MWQGEAEQRNGAVINPMLGYNPDGAKYTMDLDKCAEEFKASSFKTEDGRSLWDAGFYMQIDVQHWQHVTSDYCGNNKAQHRAGEPEFQD